MCIIECLLSTLPTGLLTFQVKGEKTSHEVNPKQALRQTFTAINKDETIVNLTDTVRCAKCPCDASHEHATELDHF